MQRTRWWIPARRSLPRKTPYFYSTYDEDNEAKQFIAERSDPDKKKVLVFGSGPIRIGQGIEFDYCSVHCVWTLKKHGCEAVHGQQQPRDRFHRL